MALTYEAAERLFAIGEFQEIRRCTDFGGAALIGLSPAHRLLIAHALALMGDLAGARRLVSHVGSDGSSPNNRSRAEAVLGLVCECSGAMAEALDHFHAALRLAHAAKDDVQIAWSHLRLLRHMIDRGSTNAIGAMLADARRATTRAGTPHVTAFLHECVAIAEGQIGRFDEARRHCDIADSLLATAPNAWLIGCNLVNRACLALLNCDFGDATQHLTNARRTLAGSGARSGAVDANLGHCQMLTGRFEKALETLRRAVDSERSSHIVKSSALEGLARLNLALGRLQECDNALNELEATKQGDALMHTFHTRWAAITRGRYYLRAGRAQEALDFLTAKQSQLSSMGDVPLDAAMDITIAQATARLGDLANAAKRLLRANGRNVTEMRELQGSYYFACASVLHECSSPLADQLRDRAFRLWKQQEVVSVPLEMAEPENADRLSGQPVVGSRRDSRRQFAYASSLALDSVAAALDVAETPRLLGVELLSLIDASGCSASARLTEEPQTDSPCLRPEQDLLIPLGRDRNKRVVLACPIPSGPHEAVVLGAIARIASAAITLQTFRNEIRNRAPLWPADPVEEQGGALFVAEEMQTLLAVARRVAPTNVPVLITGETGTGKEILARTIHGCSTRARAAFLPFNCTSTPKDMLDSQLFGHRRGAFTGATDNFPGVIRAAAGGTLFLDEIGDMGLDLQPKLLRFLESGDVHPVGETHPVRVDVRVVVATNANLDALVADGSFREDLFYRLNIVRLHVPPLRERRVEIPALAAHYLQKYALECGKGDLRLAEETMEYLMLYRWPGNVRQLANEMRRMAALCEAGAVLMPEHLSAEIAASRRTIPASDRVLDPTEVVVRLDQPLAAAAEHLERAMLQYALTQCGGRIEETAARLGLSRKGLYLKRQRFGIDPPDAQALGTA